MTHWRISSLVASLSLVALLGIPASLAAQGATEPEPQQEQQDQEPQQDQAPDEQEARPAPHQDPAESEPAPAPPTLPHVTGTVLVWNGYRIDLKTSEGKTLQVAVNKDTEQLVEIERGAEVRVEYRRKVGDFVIAERVRPAEEAGSEPEGSAEN